MVTKKTTDASAPKAEKAVTHPQFAAFPSLFKKTGEARRIKGFRASREMFQRAIRIGRALEDAPRLAVFTPVGMMVLSAAATTLLKQEDAVSALILNGYEIIPFHGDSEAIDAFLADRNMLKREDLFTGNMFEEGEGE